MLDLSAIIPTWLIGVLMIYTGLIWLVSRKRSIRMDSRIFAITFIIEGLVYGIAYYFLQENLEIKIFMSRLMVLMICFSQALPLTISFIRSVRRGE